MLNSDTVQLYIGSSSGRRFQDPWGPTAGPLQIPKYLLLLIRPEFLHLLCIFTCYVSDSF